MTQPLYFKYEPVGVVPSNLPPFDGIVLEVRYIEDGLGFNARMRTVVGIAPAGYYYIVSNDPYSPGIPWAEKCLRKKQQGCDEDIKVKEVEIV